MRGGGNDGWMETSAFRPQGHAGLYPSPSVVMSRNGARQGRCGQSATAAGRPVRLLSRNTLRDDKILEYRDKSRRLSARPPGQTLRAARGARACSYRGKRVTLGFSFPPNSDLSLYDDFLSSRGAFR